MAFTKVVPAPKSVEKVLNVRENPFIIPEAIGEKEKYVLTIVENAPFESYTIGGVGVHKNVLPTDFSLVKNQNKFFAPNVLVREFAQNQIVAIKAELSKRKMRIPTKIVEDEEGQEQVESAKEVNVSDYLTISKLEEFNPNPFRREDNFLQDEQTRNVQKNKK